MSGWTKVILATGILLVAIVGFNIALWRRLREARRLGVLAEQAALEEQVTLEAQTVLEKQAGE